MSSRAVNVLAGLIAGACVAALVTLATPPTVAGVAHAAPQVHVWPVGGVDVGGGCWVEKVSSPATAEVICGDRSKRPDMDTADIGEVFGDTCGWVALPPAPPTYPTFDIEPAGCN